MAKVIEMPKLSDTMEEGGIANWLKKEGDFVEEGEPLVEIETDKATMEYVSPEEGTLLKILVPAGKGAALNAPIAVIGEKGESFDTASLTGQSKKEVGHGTKTEKTEKQEAPAKAPAPEKSSEKVSTPVPAPSMTSGKIKASPLAKKQAQDLGINLATVTGTGPGGRVISRDLSGVSATQGGRAPTRSSRVAPKADQSIALTMMRKTIAKRLTSAKNDAPHFYLTRSINMDAAMIWRERVNQRLAKEKVDVKVSVNDLIILAVSRALREHPEVNASFAGDSITQFGAVHVAIAVALPQGLVTPVIRNTDQLGLVDIASSARDLIQSAKKGALGNEDYAGGTFTISNLGMFGIEEFTAIINPPQAAILAVGATQKVPVVAEDGSIKVQSQMKVTMSCDHRVIDGALGAQFLMTLAEYLEVPAMALM